MAAGTMGDFGTLGRSIRLKRCHAVGGCEAERATPGKDNRVHGIDQRAAGQQVCLARSGTAAGDAHCRHDGLVWKNHRGACAHGYIFCLPDPDARDVRYQVLRTPFGHHVCLCLFIPAPIS
jgi:hypothetical protein